jgi:hypothetical protein
VGGKGLVAANLSSLNFVDLHAIFTLRPMKIDIMFLVHNFQKFGAGFFQFSFFIIFCI